MIFSSKEHFKAEYIDMLRNTYAKPLDVCSQYEKLENLVHLIRTFSAGLKTSSKDRHVMNQDKKVYYFSMEFLVGKLLENYLINLGIRDLVAEGLADLGEDLDELCSREADPGLGNGGLGRLAACFLDSLASLGVQGTGMGLRYRFGLFHQRIDNGYQIEEPDAWLENGDPWEWSKPEEAIQVRFGGYVDRQYNNGKLSFEHKGYSLVNAIPYDIPIVGYGGEEVNMLHLWSAEPVHDNIDMDAFNRGDYAEALKEQSEIEAITCILYPDDSNGIGRKLRLKQEYFLVAAGMGSIFRSYIRTFGDKSFSELPKYVSIHINDTHPALCVPEMMRILLDDYGLEWDEAWEITTHTISFTNHTVLPEALEKWPIAALQKLLPRVYMIIEEIDRRWREGLQKSGTASRDILRETSILWDGEARMANLSVIGSYSVNGVAALHTQILKDSVFHGFYTLNPDKFNNKTNGVSHRRFLLQSNPELAELICDSIGDGWIKNPAKLTELEKYNEDSLFLEQLSFVKRNNKIRLANYVSKNMHINIDPDSIFDIQVKRIHAYKRQLLNALKVLDLYNLLKINPDLPINNCTFIFAGKAAQGYAYAKEIIKFINSIADLVNSDVVVRERIKVIFIENFCVSNAQIIYPAADISEQISTAGKEASGTGNMKFMMNGALTLGTMDGANIEICEQVGKENMSIFGLSAQEVENFTNYGGYHSKEVADSDPRLSKLMRELVDGTFKRSGQDFWGIYDALITKNDEYFVLKDFDSYVNAWGKMNADYCDQQSWQRKSLANIAKSGYFSSDRTIAEYCNDIWKIRK